MTLQEALNHRLTWALGSGLLTVVVAYFTFSRDILKELHFLKGQNAFLLKRFELLDKVHDRVLGLDRDSYKVRYDLDNAWKEIRNIKGGKGNGSHHAHAE